MSIDFYYLNVYKYNMTIPDLMIYFVILHLNVFYTVQLVCDKQLSTR